MKFIGFVVVAVCLGTCSARILDKITSAVSDTTNLVRKTALIAVNAHVNLVISTANLAVNMTNKALNAAESAVKAVSTGAVNTGIGVLLFEMRSVLKATGNKSIAIPDISTNLGPVKFTATNGFFRDISTLTQAGKANVSMNGTSILIDIPIKLNEFDTGYENFTVSMWKVKAGGGLKVHISNDTFVIHLVLKPGLTCALNVKKIDVTEFSGIEVDFINMGSKSEWVLEKCSNFIIKFMKERIKKQAQTILNTNIKKVLKENGSICSKFLG
ncbi:hypothetical protein GE061_003955 [Apolygus lucorum]|uniref:Lipid-binding serum glycoprotein N-terminal domain-containing protein n=1 Tax=Apolygus lucorum TaxID=248454 RepID=A0A8S9WZA2_APOLU|nr:hypothetical protein GE061_003955 [Apolygus lucorum]